ncbi:hypothetical protein LOTGIDRAFT_170732 [Lottia gigantea]|uniref:Death domain-containing protein n=1 Tax=Lottia gigantea TaxID=225164 RepID=V4B2X8_LOTGI|nr:hypothetical protein LOTGIDRAFT_170732 [Lottia gigantea]ESP04488.1 hypothetical protein LOTGIDRAFT_170732 [Lottia gigantea]
MSSSKPEWLTEICKILVNDLDQLDVLVVHLGSPNFNATVKWAQLNNQQRWCEQNTHPSLTQIISALQDMNKPDIVNLIKNKFILKKQLILENEGIENLRSYSYKVGGTPRFNAAAKWQQLNNQQIETQFYKFMNVWYEQSEDPSLTKILSAVGAMRRNDIVNFMLNDVNLKKQFHMEIKRTLTETVEYISSILI